MCLAVGSLLVYRCGIAHLSKQRDRLSQQSEPANDLLLRQFFLLRPHTVNPLQLLLRLFSRLLPLLELLHGHLEGEAAALVSRKPHKSN